LVALRSTRVVDTLQTISGRPIAVTNSVRIDIRIAVARFTNADRSGLPGRVSKVSVTADVASRAYRKP